VFNIEKWGKEKMGEHVMIP
jgi:hypothetical protein